MRKKLPAEGFFPLPGALFQIIQAAIWLPVPLHLAVRAHPQGDIGPRRQSQQHLALPAPSPCPQAIGSGSQEGKHRAAAQHSQTLGASRPLTGAKAHPAKGGAKAYLYAAKPVPPGKPQVAHGRLLAAKAEGAAAFYRSSFALTRYSPEDTLPNRYFPSALVLVVAIRVSFRVGSPAPVT